MDIYYVEIFIVCFDLNLTAKFSLFSIFYELNKPHLLTIDCLRLTRGLSEEQNSAN